MDDTERLMMKGLVEVIWADGEVDDREREMLGGILAQLGCSAEEIGEVGKMMMGVRSAPEEFQEKLPDDEESRREIMKVMLAMALADGRVDVGEVRFLNRMAYHLQIDDAELDDLKRETLASLESNN